MNKKIFEIAGKNTSELAKLTLCWQEAQKELLEEFQKEMYEQNVGYICDFEIQHKLEELTKENKEK